MHFYIQRSDTAVAVSTMIVEGMGGYLVGTKVPGRLARIWNQFGATSIVKCEDWDRFIVVERDGATPHEHVIEDLLLEIADFGFIPDTAIIKLTRESMMTSDLITL